MNIKAVITTLVVGSSSMASADVLTFSGSASLSLSSHTHTSVARRPVVVSPEDCGTSGSGYVPRPSNRPTIRQPQLAQPAIWQESYYNPTTTFAGNNASSYTGQIFTRRFVAQNHNWYDLTEPTRIDVNREFINIGADKGTFRGIRLEALGRGRSRIDQVAIEFADATGRAKTQVVKLDTWIGRGNASLAIDLEGDYRVINRVVVYGATDQGAAYKLMAR